jgi:hypothetical protein
MVINAKPLIIHVSLIRLLFELRSGSSVPFHDGKDMVGCSVSSWDTGEEGEGEKKEERYTLLGVGAARPRVPFPHVASSDGPAAELR